MIPNSILKLKSRNSPLKIKLSNSRVLLFYWQSFAQKKERKKKKENEVTFGRFQ